MANNNLTYQIAELCSSYRYDRLPADVIDIAKMSILDNMGCAVRGVREELAQIIGQELFGNSATVEDLIPMASPPGKATERAMLHAVSAHAIDFDDTFVPAKSAHAGSAVVSALTALLSECPVSGKEVIAAVVAAYEVAARVGELLHPDHYLNGFHPTCTVGVFAAAAVGARLLKLDVEQTAAAFGLAATQASGLKCTFGTMAKPFNAGNAASSGVLAAKLVARGYTAPVDALEADKGYLDMYIGLPDTERQVQGADVFRIREVLFKFHAACHATHPMIEGLQTMLAEHEFAVEDIENVTISVAELALKTASIVKPNSGLECKFSFNQVAASVLCGLNTAADETFSDAVLQDERINNVREKITVGIDTSRPIECQQIEIRLRSGETLSFEADFTDLAKDLIGKIPALKGKFMANASPQLGPGKAEQLQQAIFDIDSASDGLTALAL